MIRVLCPWCDQYKKLAPEFVEIVEVLSTNNNYVPIAKLYATVETNFSQRFNVESFPTL
jgi:hypothetical protein